MENPDVFRMELENWLHELVADEKPGSEIAAFRFGLSEAEEGYLLYLAGSKNYDEADDEWATYPPEFVAAKELLIAADEEEEWYWILLRVIHSLGRVLRKETLQNTFLGDNIPVYTGFVDGDLYRIK